MKPTFLAPLFRRSALALTALAWASVAPAAHAVPPLVTNGSFTCYTGPACGGRLCHGISANGWKSCGYTWLFEQNKATTNICPGGCFRLWGSSTSAGGGDTANGGTKGCGIDPITNPPKGGNFLALDGAFDPGILYQHINGLTAGTTYAVSFCFAGAQQFGFNACTITNQLQVSLQPQASCVCGPGPSHTIAQPSCLGEAYAGGLRLCGGKDTQCLSMSNHEFCGWYSETLDFKATSCSEVLSFLALGYPSGEPPFALLADVSMAIATPELDSGSNLTPIAVLLFGALLLAADRRRNAKSTP